MRRNRNVFRQANIEQLEHRQLLDASLSAVAPAALSAAERIALVSELQARPALNSQSTRVESQTYNSITHPRSPDNNQLAAFPGAEGLGAQARGGRGGDVYHVTNLDDTGPGSLRYGIETASGPRTIVFDVGGTIDLRSRLVIERPYLTIAGQTAPGNGITTQNYGLAISRTHDIVVRYMRFRPGDQVPDEHDTILIYKSNDVIIDHVSASWSTDEVIDVLHSKM